MERLARHVAALVAAGIGFYAGLAAAVAILGLDGAAESPIFMASFAGLASGIAVGLFDERSRLLTRIATGFGIGLVVGVLAWATDVELEWTVAGVAALSQWLAWWSAADQTEQSGI